MKKIIIFIVLLFCFTGIFAQDFTANEPALVSPAVNNKKLFIKFSSPLMFFISEFSEGSSESQFKIGINQTPLQHTIFSGMQLSAGYKIVPDLPQFALLAKFAMFFQTNPNAGTFLLSPGARASFIDDGIWNVFAGGYLNFAVQSSTLSIGPELFFGFDRKIIDILSLGSDFGLGYLYKNDNSYSSNAIFLHLDISATFYFM